MNLLLLLGGATTVELGYALTDPADTLIFNGPLGSYGVPGDLTDGYDSLEVFGAAAWFVFTAGSMADGADELFLNETTFGMLGTAGSMVDAADTLSLVAAGGAYVGASFALSDPADTLVFAVANGIDAAAQEYTLYALNLKNGSVTRLPYAADSFCELNGTLYAVGPVGIMVFEGSDLNNGAVINSRIAKGDMTFGTSKLKTITDFYMLCRTRGQVKVSVWSETSAGNVTTNDDFDVLHGFKSDLPRGVKGRQLGVAIENVDGADFKLHELEFEVDISEHRRGRQVR